MSHSHELYADGFDDGRAQAFRECIALALQWAAAREPACGGQALANFAEELRARAPLASGVPRLDPVPAEQSFDGITGRLDALQFPWQPMREAPKDGTAVLALLNGSDIPHAIRWDKDLGRWCMTWDGFELTNTNGPRYWMPCPDDPDADGVEVKS